MPCRATQGSVRVSQEAEGREKVGGNYGFPQKGTGEARAGRLRIDKCELFQMISAGCEAQGLPWLSGPWLWGDRGRRSVAWSVRDS